jgi:hypothetical protein
MDAKNQGRFGGIVQKTIELGAAREASEAAQARRRGAGISATDVDEVFTQSPEEAALNDHLSSLDVEDLRKIRTLMYLGRDHGAFKRDDAAFAELSLDDLEARNLSVGRFHRSLPNEEKKLIAMTIEEKVPLPSYLRAGLRMAKRLGADVEAPF